LRRPYITLQGADGSPQRVSQVSIRYGAPTTWRSSSCAVAVSARGDLHTLLREQSADRLDPETSRTHLIDKTADQLRRGSSSRAKPRPPSESHRFLEIPYFPLELFDPLLLRSRSAGPQMAINLRLQRPSAQRLRADTDLGAVKLGRGLVAGGPSQLARHISGLRETSHMGALASSIFVLAYASFSLQAEAFDRHHPGERQDGDRRAFYRY
jgi:hypothetical protein